jgi:hypothetical protein
MVSWVSGHLGQPLGNTALVLKTCTLTPLARAPDSPGDGQAALGVHTCFVHCRSRSHEGVALGVRTGVCICFLKWCHVSDILELSECSLSSPCGLLRWKGSGLSGCVWVAGPGRQVGQGRGEVWGPELWEVLTGLIALTHAADPSQPCTSTWWLEILP